MESIGNVKLLTNDMKHLRSVTIEQDQTGKRRAVGYRVLQWTWGLPQSMLGAGVYLYYKNAPHATFYGASVTIWPHRSSMSLGMFLFISEELFDTPSAKKEPFQEGSFARRLLVHEYGHSIQSLMFGPLYLATVGLPSMLWANLPTFQKYRKRNRRSYYSVYPEKHADKLGSRILREKAVGNVFTDF